jgi:hypothetical protein
MERQEILYLLLGLALGVIFTSILFLRIPSVVKKAHDLGIQKKAISGEERVIVEKTF